MSETRLTSLADLPTQYDRERAEAKRLNRESRGRARKPGKLAAVAAAPIAWLREPAYIGGIRVLGVASDASEETRAAWL